MPFPRISAFFIILLWLILSGVFTWELILNYFSHCENRDFLSWDGDLRFVSALQLLDNLRNAEIGKFFYRILDTPTWPFLRNLLQLSFWGIFGISPEYDFVISLVFGILTFGLISFSIWQIGENDTKAGILGIGLGLFLYFSPMLLTYSFSSMLETQGGCFLLITCLAFLFFLEQKKIDYERRSIYLLFSFLGLYLTKYPYGYIFVLTAFVLLTLQFPNSAHKLIEIYLPFRKNGKWVFPRRSLWILAILGLVLTFLLPSEIWKGKSKTYAKYFFSFLFVVDFFLFFFKNREAIQNENKFIYKSILLFVLPVLFWTMIHPDRFGSSGGTLQHVQMEGHAVGEIVEKNLSYYLYFGKVLFIEIWKFSGLGIVLGFFFFASLVWGTKKYIQEKILEKHFSISLFVLLHLIILTFLTANHQARHVYHLVPLLLLGTGLFILQLPKKIYLATSIILFLSSSYFAIDFYKKEIDNIPLCFSGNGEIYEPPRYLETVLETNWESDGFFWNRIEENHLHRADVELIYAKVSFRKRKRFETNPRTFLQDETKHTEVISFGRNCESKWNLKTKKEFILQKTLSSEQGCVQFWKRP